MKIQTVNNSYNTQFRAKFIDNYAIKKVAQWAKENGKFAELNEARKRIDSIALDVRLELTLGRNVENDCPIAIFRRYTPKDILPENPTNDDFVIAKPITYQTRRIMNPFEFGYERIMQMSNHVTKNKMYRHIVIGNTIY